MLHILASVMRRLDDLHLESKSTTIFLPSTGPLDGHHYHCSHGRYKPFRRSSLCSRSSLSIIYGCLRLGPVSARKIVEAGVLIPLLKLASFDSESGFLHYQWRFNRTTPVSTSIVMWSRHVKGGFAIFTTANLQPGGLVKTSRKELPRCVDKCLSPFYLSRRFCYVYSGAGVLHRSREMFKREYFYTMPDVSSADRAVI